MMHAITVMWEKPNSERAEPRRRGSSLFTQLIVFDSAEFMFVEICAVGALTCEGHPDGLRALAAVYLVVMLCAHFDSKSRFQNFSDFRFGVKADFKIICRLTM